MKFFIVTLKITQNQNFDTMGIFWDLMQENKLKEQQDQADSLEERVGQLEMELARTKELLSKTLVALEEHIGEDIDGDGITGA